MTLKEHLSDNHADESMEHMIIIAIAFVAGAIMIAAVWAALTNHFSGGIDRNIHDYLGN